MLRQTTGAITKRDTVNLSPRESVIFEKGGPGRELAEFLKTELTACLTSANHAATMRKAGDEELAQQALDSAEKSYATVFPFLSDSIRSRGLKAEELEEFRAQLEQSRKTLDDLEKFRRISLLAYEFWLERGCPQGTSEEDWFRAEQEIAGLNRHNA